MTPTKEEWKQIEQRLKVIYDPVKLSVDGYTLGIYLAQVRTYKNEIMIYVNGEFRGIWLGEDCEERRRFLCPKQSYTYGRRYRNVLKKLARSKRQSPVLRKEAIADAEAKTTHYTPFWTSFPRLKAHLLKNNTSIEWINKPQPAEHDPLRIAAEGRTPHAE